MKTRVRWMILFASVLIFLPLLFPLLSPGTLHQYDMAYHIQRIVGFYRSLQDGIVPPSWSTYLAYGFGSPVLIFNWSFPYYLASVILPFGVPLVDTYKIMTAVAYIGSFIGMFVLLKTLTSSLPALTGATWYVWAPYRFQIHQLRGAIGEQCAMMFWPWILWITLLIFKKRYGVGFLIGSLLWAGLVLSQQPLFSMIIPLWLMVVFMEFGRTRDRKALFASLGGLVFGMGLMAFSWMSIAFERHFLGYGVHEMIFPDNFLEWQRLISHPKLLEYWFGPIHLFYVIGWPLIGIAGITLLHLIGNIRNSQMAKIRPYQVLFLFMGIFAIFLLHKSSTALWQNLPMLAPVMEYPQRFMALAVFCTSLLVGLFVYSWKKGTSVLLALVCIFIIIVFDYPFLFLNTLREPNLKELNTPVLTTTDVWGEFSPKDIPQDFQKNGIFFIHEPMITVTPPGKTSPNCSQTSISISCSVHTAGPATIRFRQFYFPGWTAWADNKKIPVGKRSDGTIELSVPGPTSAVRITYEGTLLQKCAKLLSLGFFGVYVFFLINIVSGYRKKKHGSSV